MISTGLLPILLTAICGEKIMLGFHMRLSGRIFYDSGVKVSKIKKFWQKVS